MITQTQQHEQMYLDSIVQSDAMIRLCHALAESTLSDDVDVRNAASRAYKDGATRYKEWAAQTEAHSPALVADTDRALEQNLRAIAADHRGKQAELIEYRRLRDIATAAMERDAEKRVKPADKPKKARPTFGNSEPEI